MSLKSRLFRRLFLSLLVISPALAGLVIVAAPNTTYAANPATINFQGKVVNSDGTNVTNGSYSFIFRLYDNSSPTIGANCNSNSQCWWEETQSSITVTNGVFQVELGSSCAFTSACSSSHSGIDWNTNNALYLTMKFNGDTSGSNNGFMTPVVHLTSVPYAYNADKLGGLASSAFGQLSVSNSWTNTNSITLNSASAFQVQNASNNAVLSVETSATEANNLVRLGKASTINGRLVFNNTNNTNTATIVSGVTGSSYSLTLPTSGPSTSQCLQTDSVTASQLTFNSCGGGATVGLTNLSGVAINTSLLPGTGNSIDLGDATHSWRNLYIGTSIQTAASTDLALQPATGIVSLNKASTNNELRVYENSGSPTNYASITAGASDATFKSNTGTTKIGSGVGSITLNAGTGAAVNITGHDNSVWQTDGSATLDIASGGALTLNSGTAYVLAASGDSFQVQGTGNFLAASGQGLDNSAASGTLTVGATNATTINIGNGSGSTAVTVSCGTGTCGFGTNATDHSTTVGSTTGTSATTLRGGTGGATISSTATSTAAVTVSANSVNTGTALTVSDTGLTTGTGLQVTVGNPQANANSGVLTTASLINVGSANHNFLSLTNRELTFGGHINQISISNIQNTYVYDTAADRDGGRWTSDDKAKASSWYNETKDHNQSACVIGTDDRCGASAFPSKAVLVVAGSTGSNTLYIFDAEDNSLWMSFTQNAGSTLAMGVNANNIMSSVYAINGSIYIATNGSAASGVYEINFKSDKITKINNVDSRDYAGNIANRNTAQTTAYADQNRTGVKLTSTTANDIHANIVNGKTYIVVANGNATAANGGMTLINETAQSVANFGPANENYQSVWITADDSLYGLSSTTNELDVWYNASASSGNNIAKSTFYDETTKPAISSGNAQPTINTSAPDALYVSNGTSDIDGQSNSIYVGHNNGLSVIQEKVGAESGGAVKVYTTNYISEEYVGDVRNFLPFNGSGALTNSSNLTDTTVKGNGLTVKNTNGTGITYGSGVRGTAITGLDNTDDYICTGTGGTCADDADLDSAVASTGNFSIGAWAKRSATGTDADTLIAKWGNTGANQAYRIHLSTTNVLTCDHNAVTIVTGPTVTDTANWHSYVCVFDNSADKMYLYVDGTLYNSGGTADTNNTPDSAVAYTIGANLSSGGNGPQDFFRGSVDEPFVTATALTSSQARYMYEVGYRALNNPNHAGSSTIRGATVSADGANALNGSSVVKAVMPSHGSGQLYVGTSGGVAVVGLFTDTLTDLYTTSITSKDDINTNYDATNGNAVNSVSVTKGYGSGTLLSIGFNNTGSGGVWIETSSTGLIDFLGNSYDPFGTNLTQTNLAVDRVFRVTNQISTKLSNFSMPGTNQPQIYDLMRVDSNGLTLAPGSTLNGSTIMKATDATGNKIFEMRNIATNFGSLLTGGAFVSQQSYFGEEFSASQLDCLDNSGATASEANILSRGTMATGRAIGGTVCSTTDGDNNTTEISTAKVASVANASNRCDFQNGAAATNLNGYEVIKSGVSTTNGHTTGCLEYLGTNAAGTGNKIFNTGNLPQAVMKFRQVNVGSQQRMFIGLSDKVAGAASMATGDRGAYFTNCTAPTTPTCGSTLVGAVSDGATTPNSATSTNAVACPSTDTDGSSYTANTWSYGRIEFRRDTSTTTVEIQFFVDYNVTNGIHETSCGTVTTTGAAMGNTATTMLAMSSTASTGSAITTEVDLDYYRVWQDDAPVNPDTTTAESNDNNSGNDSSSNNLDSTLLSDPPLINDSAAQEDKNSFFSFNAATSEDTVINKDLYVKGTLFADKIKANQIEGLEIFTDKISSLQQRLASAIDPKASAQTKTSTQNDVLPTSSSALNLNIPGSLSVNGPAEFHGNVLFYKLVTFTEKSLFNNDITFAAHVNTAGDSPSAKLEANAGITKMPADNPSAVLAKAAINGNDNSGVINLKIGDNAAEGELLTINFNKPYEKPPQIFLTPANKEAAQFKYFVTSAKDGFKLVATDPLPAGTNLQFYYWVVQ